MRWRTKTQESSSLQIRLCQCPRRRRRRLPLAIDAADRLPVHASVNDLSLHPRDTLMLQTN